MEAQIILDCCYIVQGLIDPGKVKHSHNDKSLQIKQWR